ncbi:MAG: hypothetical protein U0930_06065 [Pirellulales bacterium]
MLKKSWMILSWFSFLFVALSPFLLSQSAVIAQSTDGEKITKVASWDWPKSSGYDGLISSYLDQRQASVEVRAKVEQSWKSAEGLKGPAFLDRLLDTCANLEPRLSELNIALRSIDSPITAPKDIPWLVSDVPGWLQDTVRLACGRAFAQRKMYDEALETLSGLELAQVCDPASLLFYRASAEHHLLKKSECLSNLKALLERESELPARYRQVSHLMQSDIAPLKEDSLDEIARLMTDVGRRLELGRAGQKVRDEEEDIVKKLDKMIEQIEEQARQMQQQQQQQQNQQNQMPENMQQKPMDESQIAGGPKGAGDVDQKKLEQRSGWGNLPPAQRQEALQRLTEELPTHYRDVIEGYFRQLAKERP